MVACLAEALALPGVSLDAQRLLVAGFGGGLGRSGGLGRWRVVEGLEAAGVGGGAWRQASAAGRSAATAGLAGCPASRQAVQGVEGATSLPCLAGPTPPPPAQPSIARPLPCLAPHPSLSRPCPLVPQRAAPLPPTSPSPPPPSPRSPCCTRRWRKTCCACATCRTCGTGTGPDVPPDELPPCLPPLPCPNLPSPPARPPCPPACLPARLPACPPALPACSGGKRDERLDYVTFNSSATQLRVGGWVGARQGVLGELQLRVGARGAGPACGRAHAAEGAEGGLLVWAGSLVSAGTCLQHRLLGGPAAGAPAVCCACPAAPGRPTPRRRNGVRAGVAGAAAAARAGSPCALATHPGRPCTAAAAHVLHHVAPCPAHNAPLTLYRSRYTAHHVPLTMYRSCTATCPPSPSSPASPTLPSTAWRSGRRRRWWPGGWAAWLCGGAAALWHRWACLVVWWVGLPAWLGGGGGAAVCFNCCAVGIPDTCEWSWRLHNTFMCVCVWCCWRDGEPAAAPAPPVAACLPRLTRWHAGAAHLGPNKALA